ncbi:MAG: glycosyl hydrolase 53 family protein [Calditrichia bacterium]
MRLLLILFFPIVLFAQQSENDFFRGVDVSYLQKVEDSGGTFRVGGVPRDALEVFAENGVNAVRLRVWNNPADGYSNLQKTLEIATRVKTAGMQLLLDFHYSDTWADPGNQTKPAVWMGLPFSALSDSVYQYTNHVVGALAAQQTPPDVVQIGNEIICGMLWNEGRVCDGFNTPQQWSQLAQLIGSGGQGVRDALGAGDSTKIMIHIDRGGDNGSSRWFFDNLTAQNVEFDIIGQSFYPWWHGDLNDLTSNLTDMVNRYNKEVVVVETAYPWTLNFGDNTGNIVGLNSQLLNGYPASVNGQRWFVRDVMNIVRNLPNNRGTGVFYWEAAWISAPQFGSAWENLAFFDFAGNVQTSIDVFNPPVTGIEDDNPQLPQSLSLRNYPNPFNPTTQIEFELDSPTQIELRIFNVNGQQIRLLSKGYYSRGLHAFEWNGLDDIERPVASGPYWYVLKTDFTSSVRQMTLTR